MHLTKHMLYIYIHSHRYKYIYKQKLYIIIKHFLCNSSSSKSNLIYDSRAQQIEIQVPIINVAIIIAHTFLQTALLTTPMWTTRRREKNCILCATIVFCIHFFFWSVIFFLPHSTILYTIYSVQTFLWIEWLNALHCMIIALSNTHAVWFFKDGRKIKDWRSRRRSFQCMYWKWSKCITMCRKSNLNCMIYAYSDSFFSSTFPHFYIKKKFSKYVQH